MSPKKPKMFDIIDTTGDGNKNDPRMREVEDEMIRSHELCLKISSKNLLIQIIRAC